MYIFWRLFVLNILKSLNSSSNICTVKFVLNNTKSFKYREKVRYMIVRVYVCSCVILGVLFVYVFYE